MNFVMDYGQFGRACRACDDPDECDMLGYCPLDLSSGHSDDDGDALDVTAIAPEDNR